ncbi:hypothetical protein [Arhodomonas sp. AD133]|uniref:hypothetical protein n=1 Tax=Arhodomonas sp. AD133 TaxID=3415009 RepID=UPI003EBAB7A2
MASLVRARNTSAILGVFLLGAYSQCGFTSDGGLLVSQSPDRSNPTALAQATLDPGGDYYIFYDAPASDIGRVTFHINGERYHREYMVPYDMEGGPVKAARAQDMGAFVEGRNVVGVSVDGEAAAQAAFTVGDSGPDTTPEPFDFQDVADVQPGVLVASAPITVTGIDAAAPISIVGGEYSIDGGAFTSADGTVGNGSSVTVRTTAADCGEPPVTAVLMVGGVSASFNVTTIADDGGARDASEVLFEEDFDDQPDWTSAMHSTDRVQTTGTHIVPEGWYSIRQDPTWSPSMGHSDRHETIEILARNSDKTRTGTGKSYVSWRDSIEDPQWYWASESMLSKYFPEGHDELFVRFWIRFDPDWTPLGDTGMSKLFRISAWDEDKGNIYKAFGDGPNGPIMLWDYYADSYGARNKLALRGHPTSEHYLMTDPKPINLPRRFGNGSASLNFDSNIRDLNGDGVEDNEVDSLFNLVTGEPVSGIVSHDELWGDKWHKIEFHVKMNSGPGVFDGVLEQWIDDQLVFRNTEMPWRGYDSTGEVKWNVVHIGGNDHFHAYSDQERREEWYAIDDILIATKPPEKDADGVCVR